MVCGIEESRKANMTNGYQLFNRLRHKGLISNENVSYLKQILSTVKRRDLVRLVEEFEDPEITTKNTEAELKDFSWESTTSAEANPASKSQKRHNSGGSSDGTAMLRYDSRVQVIPRRESNPDIACCIVNWPCVNMSCYKIHFCYVILIVLFLLAIIITSLLWYADVPVASDHLKDKPRSGLFVIAGLIVTFPIFLLIAYFARKYIKRRESAVMFSRENTSCSPVSPHFITTGKHNDPAPLVGGSQMNPNFEIEKHEEQTLTTRARLEGRTSLNNTTTGDTEPILSPEN